MTYLQRSIDLSWSNLHSMQLETTTLLRTMHSSWHDYDAIFAGGGFYGCCLALEFADRFRRILIVEREHDLLTRASYANQARA